MSRQFSQVIHSDPGILGGEPVFREPESYFRPCSTTLKRVKNKAWKSSWKIFDITCEQGLAALRENHNCISLD